MKTPPVQIKQGIYWVGALNPELRRFDVIMETTYGTSYNAYLVIGEEKTALIETVKDGFLQESLDRIQQIVDPAKLDYIILEHTEPDHSGAIVELMEVAKNATIYCSKAASLNLVHIANRDLPIKDVRDLETLELGNCTLTFHSAPFLHWPDTIFTYHHQSGALFTCDAFGCHYAASEVLESKTDPEFKQARRYYYDCIVSPFAPHVLRAIDMVRNRHLQITAILPSHGPVLDVNPMEAVTLYEQWANERSVQQNRAFIGYVSCYGYTRTLAQQLEEELTSRGMQVEIVDVSLVPVEDLVERVYRAGLVAFGSPTVNSDALLPVWNVLCALSVPLMRNKPAAAFGSFGWSGEAVPMMEQRLNNLGCKVLGTVKVRFRPNQEDLDQMSVLADKLALAVQF